MSSSALRWPRVEAIEEMQRTSCSRCESGEGSERGGEEGWEAL